LDLTQVKRAAEHDLGWDRVLLQHQLAAIDVVEEQVEGAQTLLQAGFQSPPRAGVDDPRDDVKWKHLLGALGVRVDGEGDPVVAEHLHRQGRPALELVRTQAVQLLVKSTVGGSRPSGGRKHLVIEAVELVVGIKIHETHRYSVCAIPQPERTINLRAGRAAPQIPIDDTPGELLHFTLPSRYCLSDQLMGMAWELFGQTDAGGARVQAVCDWVHDNIKFQYGTSNPLTTAVDVLEQRRG